MPGIRIFLLILTLLAVSCSSNLSKDNKKMEFAEPCCDSDIDRAILLKPFFREQPDGSVIFGISATRQAKVEGEYCPSSETFRVDITNQKGKTIWSSNNNKMHMQVISDVLPTEPGKSHDYELRWNGTDNSGNIVKAGLYNIRMIIPAKPKAYFSEFKYEWNPDNEK